MVPSLDPWTGNISKGKSEVRSQKSELAVLHWQQGRLGLQYFYTCLCGADASQEAGGRCSGGNYLPGR